MDVLTKTIVVELNDLSSINQCENPGFDSSLSLHFPSSPLKMKWSFCCCLCIVKGLYLKFLKLL